MITVFVENLKFKTIIGLLDFERTNSQNISINAKFRADEFIDYVVVCEFITDEFHKAKFLKVEDALRHFDIEFKRLYPSLEYFFMKITKSEIMQNADVGAQIEHFY